MTGRTLLSLFGATLALSACALDDRNVQADKDDSGGRGGASGSDTGGKATGGSPDGGTSTGGKGGSTTGGTAGKGGSTTGGTAGKGGTAGTGPEDCNGDPLEVDEDLIRACLMQIGCNPFIPGYTLSFCVSQNRLRTFSQDDCGSNVTTCDEYFDCLGVGFHEAPDCTTGDAAYCDDVNNVALTCRRYPYAIDCERRGGECTTYLNDEGNLTARCAQPTVGACIDPAGSFQCSNQIAYTCIDGQAIGTDCGETGAECRDGDCYYVLPSCSDPGTATCGTDARMDICYEPGDLARYYCAAGLGCLEGDADTACVAPGCTTEEPCRESCDGTELTLCYGGIPFTLDCTDYGFKYCDEGTLPSNDLIQTAYCSIPDTAPDRVCEPVDTDDTCQVCQKEECCDEWTTCVDDAECVGFLNCSSDCATGDSVCVEACGADFPAGVIVYQNFYDCRVSSCTTC